MKVFSSGSCRLVTTIHNGRDKVTPIHSMFHNFVGINFLGKLHNTKQHIQFIKFIKDEITLTDDILAKFLTAYITTVDDCADRSSLSIKKENIKNQFDECEWYIIEICSLKRYILGEFDVQYELTNEYSCILQTEDEILADLHTIRELIPPNKKLLFQVHFRPNIIYNDPSKIIKNREVLFNVITQFCKKMPNTYIYDPSVLLQSEKHLFDGDTNFTQDGHIKSFNYIYDNYLDKIK
jgi:hypothetical protein